MQTRRRRKHATMRRRCQHSATSADAYSDRVNGLCFDDVERAVLCELLEQLGPDAPTTLAPWTTRDIAVHLYMREHDALAGPGLVLPGPWSRLAARHHRRATRQDFSQVVAAVRSGPRGLFRLRWLRRVPNLNEMFIHHEDVRRANGGGPRAFDPAMDRALWSNVKGGAWILTRRLRHCGLELRNASTQETFRARRGTAPARVAGEPGELLLYLFGRQGVAHVELDGPPSSLERVRTAKLGLCRRQRTRRHKAPGSRSARGGVTHQPGAAQAVQ